MKTKTLAIIAIALSATTASAETLRQNSVVCFTADQFSQMSMAQAKKDNRGIRYMLDNGCGLTKQAYDVSVLDTTWHGSTRVRVYADSGTVAVWTYIENVH